MVFFMNFKNEIKMLRCNHKTKFVMIFVLRIRSLCIWIQTLFINTSAMMFKSMRQNVTSLSRQYEHLGRSFLTEKPLIKIVATAVRKHFHEQNDPAHFSSFSLIGNASKNYNLKLKESLAILK